MPETGRIGGADTRRGGDHAARLGRVIGPWLVACVAAATFLVFGSGAFYAVTNETGIDQVGRFLLGAIPVTCYITFVIAALTAIPMMALVFIMRRAQVVRGIGDVVLGGVMGAALTRAMGVSLLPGSDELWQAAMFFAAGAIGGLTYWLLAGRPRPPY